MDTDTLPKFSSRLSHILGTTRTYVEVDHSRWVAVHKVAGLLGANIQKRSIGTVPTWECTHHITWDRTIRFPEMVVDQ